MSNPVSRTLDLAAAMINLLSTRLTTLEAAIRTHRDQRGDDRCWMDDETLYRVLPEGYTPPERDTEVELSRCQQFIRNRKNPQTEYVSPQRRIEELEAERDTLAVDLGQLRFARNAAVATTNESLRRLSQLDAAAREFYSCACIVTSDEEATETDHFNFCQAIRALHDVLEKKEPYVS